MYQRRRARVLLAILVLVALVLVTIDFRSGSEGPLDRLRSIATSVFGPIQDGLATIIRPVGDAIDSVSNVFSLREENERLRARLAELEERRRSFDDLLAENDELRELLGMQERTGFEVIPARVVAQAPSNYELVVTLAVGSNDGVARDMPVINQDGLVGRVIQVTPSASRVLLAIDPNFGAAARVATSLEQGQIAGQGADLMRFQPFDPELDIDVGAEIVTSSYSNGIFPSGIPIGSVASVGETTTLLTRDVLVRPYVDFTSLNIVLVVKHAPIEEPPPLEGPVDGEFTPPDLPDPSPSPEPTATSTATETGQ
ncbi:MAG: rod shape-determining protein MreC [Actinobacteria bacterium]|nr:rod shape-determining protein MreC [Actinomycetota bacterium]